MMQIGRYIGIDFGTTNTSVVSCYVNEHGEQITKLGENGDYPFSSIVAIPKNGGVMLFGRAVRDKRLELAETHEVYTSMKSFLGKKVGSQPLTIKVGENEYSPKEIVTAFFKHIKEYVGNNFSIDITMASLSYPVDFTPEARHELREAAEAAGIEVKMFVSESTAAYIASRNECKAFSKVMVLDWGGGTFDISILKLVKSSIREIAICGEKIGGDDIDRELAQRMHSRIAAGSEMGRFDDMPPAERDQMIMRCEQAKIAISNLASEDDHPLTIKDYGTVTRKTILITTEQFDNIVEPIIRIKIFAAINRALHKAQLSPASIDGVIIVGGSSELKAYERAMQNIFKDTHIIRPKDPAWASAKGAALMQIVSGTFRLSEGVGVELSNGTVCEILPSGIAIGEHPPALTFSLTEDALGAHFIFTDLAENKAERQIYKTQSVETKGFLSEKLELSAVITDDQVAQIDITNKYFGTNADTGKRTVELSKLNFYYEVSALDEG